MKKFTRFMYFFLISYSSVIRRYIKYTTVKIFYIPIQHLFKNQDYNLSLYNILWDLCFRVYNSNIEYDLKITIKKYHVSSDLKSKHPQTSLIM